MAKFESLLPHLDERQRRLALGAEARVLGHGGIKAVARASGVSAVTVSNGASPNSRPARHRWSGSAVPARAGNPRQ
jgi:hypothetical protein